jgi:hypothetical protein
MVDIAPTSEARRAALAAPVTGIEGPDAAGDEVPDAAGDETPGADGPGGTGGSEGADGPEVTPTGEQYLLSFAGRQPIGAFQRLLRRFAHVADPDADERGYRQATEREFVDLAPTWGGYHLAGFLTTEHGQQLRTALDALMTPGAGAGGGGDARSAGATNVSESVAGTPAGTSGVEPADRGGATLGDRAAGDQTAEDRRTVQQRRAQALADLARVILDGGLVSPGASVRPHVTVHVSWTELQRVLADADRRSAAEDPDADRRAATESTATDTATDRLGAARGGGVRAEGADPTGLAPSRSRPRRGSPSGLSPGWAPGAGPPQGARLDVRALTDPESDFPAWADDVGPIPQRLLAKIACDAEVTRVVFGPDSQVLDVGRARRTVTGQLRRAVIARDRRCTWPGCQEPPARCEVHHAVTHWADGGVTSVDNAALLCWHHHTVVDTTGVRMRWEGGVWAFTDRHGRRITAVPRASAHEGADGPEQAARPEQAAGPEHAAGPEQAAEVAA